MAAAFSFQSARKSTRHLFATKNEQVNLHLTPSRGVNAGGLVSLGSQAKLVMLLLVWLLTAFRVIIQQHSIGNELGAKFGDPVRVKRFS